MHAQNMIQETVSIHEIKREIVDLLHNDIRFQDPKFEDFKGGDIRFLEYFNYSDERCLTIFIVVPDGKLPSKNREEIVKFFQEIMEPINKAVSDLPLVKKASLEYYWVNIYFKETKDLDQAHYIIKP